ncbi:MAG: helix-turn-helix domain-containing protein [Actinomycetes bacterium]
MPQLIVTAVLVEGRTKSEVAREYGVSRRWVITLVQRYLAAGEAGLVPRSRRPRSSPGTGRTREAWSSTRWPRRVCTCRSSPPASPTEV